MNQEKVLKNYYLKEFSHFDGEFNIVFNILDINTDKNTITLAITCAGKISVREFDLKTDTQNNLYFEYGYEFSKIKVEDFEN